MKLRCFSLFIAVLLFSLAPAVRAKGTSADAYFGYSRVGANLYQPNTSGMNGWQFAMHVKPMPFIGFEGDISHYGQSAGNFSQHVTLVMFGPRVTAHAAGLSVFAHGLFGIAHDNATLATFPSIGYNGASYALGGGADIPLFLGLKLRGTGDYLGNSRAPARSGLASGNSISHYRLGVGVAYHF